MLHLNRSGRILSPMVLVSIPLLLFSAIVAWAIVSQLMARSAVRAELASLKSQGIPVDNETMQAHFVAHTSKTNAVQWSEILAVSESEWMNSLADKLVVKAFDSAAPITELVERLPNDEDKVAEYLDKIQPLLDQVRQLSPVSEPVWQPLHFQGVGTLLAPLQNSRSVINKLALDFDYAVHVGQRERALSDLAAMQGVAEAFNWRTFLVGELVYIANTSIRRQTIQTNLASQIWTDDDLQQMIKLVGPTCDVAAVWPDLIKEERAMIVASIDAGSDLGFSPIGFLLAKAPLLQQQMLTNYSDLSQLGTNDLMEFLRRSEQFEKRKWDLLSAQVMPGTSACAAAFIRVENQRRMTLAAIAVKRFKLQEERFPTSLEELLEHPELGLQLTDIRRVDGTMLRYELRGNDCYMWEKLHPVTGPVADLPADPAKVFRTIMGDTQNANETMEVVLIR